MSRLIVIALSLLLTVAAGCSAPRPERPVDFPPVDAAGLEFGPSGSLMMEAGSPGELTLALRNNGTKTVLIQEWRMNEPDNVRLYCQARPQGVDAPDESMWIALDDPVRTPEYRYMLELFPRNQVLVKRTLGFVENLVLRPGTERRYFVKAELNLKSLPLSSGVFEISVIPPQR